MKKTDTASLNTVSKLFKNHWGIDVEWSKDIYSRMDGSFKWKDKEHLLEVKCRRFEKDKYPTTIIDYGKYQQLVDNQAVLVVLFDDCWGICKDVKRAFLKETEIYCRRCTDFPSESRWSSKVELDLNEFQWFEYDQ